jgi:hypothetical protein
MLRPVCFRRSLVLGGSWRLPLGILAGLMGLLEPDSAARAAGGAYVVDDIETGNPGDCKVESWVQAASNHDFAAVTSPTSVVELGIPVEFGGQFQRARSADVWTTTGGVKAKARLIPAAGHRFGLGISGGANWDMSSGANTGGFVTVLVTTQPHENLRINVNGGWLYDNVADIGYATWGVGFEWAFVKPLTLIGEVYGQYGKLPSVADGDPPSPNTTRQPKAQFGLRFTPQQSFDIDLIYGHKFGGENAHWMTLGLNLRF